MTINRRVKRRRSVSRDALLCSDDGKAIAGCQLRDVSDNGARLALDADQLAKVPAEFFLVLAKQAKVHRRCRVVWRSADELGVRFIPVPDGQGSVVSTQN
jgi:16S rRNA U1498 N3-methylase RsmE